MLFENPNSSSSFRMKIQKKMLRLKNMELFGMQTVNILLKINLSIDIASQYIYPSKKLSEIGLICDSNIIAFQKKKLSTIFYISTFLFEKQLRKETRFPIKTFTTEELSDEFLSLIKNTNDKVSNWSYFYIPFSIDSYHIQNLIDKKKCGISSILKNMQDEIDNVSKLKAQINLNQPFMKNFPEIVFYENKNFENSKISENSINNRIFMKGLHHQLPKKIENVSSNNSTSNDPKKYIFRLNFGEISEDFVANLIQTEPTLDNIITDNSTIWKPFVL